MRPLLALALVTGCVGPDAVDPTDDSHTDAPWVSGCMTGPAPSLEVGKGEQDFVPSAEDDRKSVLIHGIQGGFHSFVSVRAAHLSLADLWKLDIEGRVDDEVWARAVLERTPECNFEVDKAEANGTWLIWVGRRPPELHGQAVDIHVRAEDVHGRVVEAVGEQIIWDPELAE